MIREYAERNQAVHKDFNILMRDDRWTGLAELLYKDASELEAPIPPNAVVHLNILSKVFKNKIELFFDIDEYNPDNPQAWERTTYAKELCVKLQKETVGANELAEKSL